MQSLFSFRLFIYYCYIMYYYILLFTIILFIYSFDLCIDLLYFVSVYMFIYFFNVFNLPSPFPPFIIILISSAVSLFLRFIFPVLTFLSSSEHCPHFGICGGTLQGSNPQREVWPLQWVAALYRLLAEVKFLQARPVLLWTSSLTNGTLRCGLPNIPISDASLHEWIYHSSFMALIHFINSSLIYSERALVWWPSVNEERGKLTFRGQFCKLHPFSLKAAILIFIYLSMTQLESHCWQREQSTMWTDQYVYLLY
jgi:hypothetical protein